MANPTIYIGSKFDAKGFKQAESATSKLNKSIKQLAGTFGLAYGTKAIISFGKASLKAFVDDDKAAKALGQTIKNTGNLLAGKGAESFIAKLEATAAVSDDQLRPAFTNLLNSTRDYRLSQKELNLALDIAAGTTKDVVSVSAALAKAYAGNTGALSKLGTGISKATLATGDMVAINKELSSLFAGQAKIAADSYAGSLDKLTIAGNNAKEVIGKGIVQALTEANGGFNNSSAEIAKFAKVISDLIIDIGRLFRLVAAIPTPLEFLAKPGQGLANYNNVLKELQAQRNMDFAPATGTPSGAMAIMAKEARAADKAATKKLATDKKSAAVKLAADKKAAALKLSLGKGQAAFDLTKIQIAAALKMNIDEDTRKRLLLMQALEGDNSDLILKRLKELEDFQTASIAKIAAAQALADKSRQDALELYMKIMGLASAKFTPIGYMAPTAAQQQQIFATTGNYTPPTMAQQGQIFATAPPTNNMPEGYTSPTAAERNQIFGTTASTTVIAPTVLPVVLTDGAGFQSAIQQQLQILARDGASTAATSGLVNQFL